MDQKCTCNDSCILNRLFNVSYVDSARPGTKVSLPDHRPEHVPTQHWPFISTQHQLLPSLLDSGHAANLAGLASLSNPAGLCDPAGPANHWATAADHPTLLARRLGRRNR